MAAESSYIKTATMGTLVISDGGAVSLTLLYDRGDVSSGRAAAQAERTRQDRAPRLQRGPVD